MLNPPYRRLRAWQASHDLTAAIYRVTARWPSTERFGLTSQARRAALSIELNIAEGSARRGSREFAHFLSIAYGSATELTCLTDVASMLGMLHGDDLREIQVRLIDASRMVWRLLRALRDRSDLPDRLGN